MKSSFVSCGLLFAVCAFTASSFEFTDVKFYLFTKTKPGGVLVSTNYDSIKKAHFNPAHPTRIIVHGFLGNIKAPVIQKSVSAYLARGDFNVFGVDWGAGAGNIYTDYPGVLKNGNVKKTGAAIVHLIQAANNNKQGLPQNTMLIGHSLGAHAAGWAGKMTQYMWKKTVETIIGLDPAGPGFDAGDPTTRLASTDATYVEVIHSCAGCTFGGISTPVGDADFWPNYGINQPGCTSDGCAHERSYEFFVESLKSPNHFTKVVACPFFLSSRKNTITSRDCPSPVTNGIRMGGEPPNKNLAGNFYLKTNAKSPFAQY